MVSSSWQGSFADFAKIFQHIQRSHAFGRLSLRNQERGSIAHLYFRAGRLVHIIGHRGDARAILNDLQGWRQAALRFDRGATTADMTLNDEHERLLVQVLTSLCRRGIVAEPPAPVATTHAQMPNVPQVIEGNVVATSEGKPLISPSEWRVLVEGTRRVSLAVAHLVGPREALQVLRDILDDCASSFPAFASLTIARSGYLQVTEQTQLDRLSRDDLLEGFTALIAICQHFCTPIVGAKDAHLLMLQALRELTSPLASLGVFRVDYLLLASGDG